MKLRTRGRIFRRTATALLATAIAASIGGCFRFPNATPIAVIMLSRTEGEAPLEVRFDASGSSDADGIVTTCRWSFGDGTDASGEIVSHVYVIAGTYVVKLTVIDDDGAEGTARQTIVVRTPNVPPTASFTAAPSTAVADEPIAFNGAGSVDPDGTLVSYLWEFGDGSIGSGAYIVHRFAAPGAFPVTLTVTDDDGARASHTSAVQIVDTNAAPVASFTIDPPTAAAGDSIRFDASGSYDSDGEITSFAWQFGDGAAANGEAVTHAYAADGTYRVDLLVTDDHGVARGTSQILTIGSGRGTPGGSGETLTERYTWIYGIPRQLEIEVPTDLLEHYRSQPRNPRTFRDYDEYVLDPLDDDLMSSIAADLGLGGYYATVENALFFVQQCIEYQLDPVRFEYPRYPLETLVDRVGDCEDTAILYASLVRTLGHGALLVAVDTDGDGSPDHMAVLVPVEQSYVDGFPPGARSFWEIDGGLYAFAETAVDGGSLELGVDPWGLDTGDVTETWDVARAGVAPKKYRPQE